MVGSGGRACEAEVLSAGSVQLSLALEASIEQLGVWLRQKGWAGEAHPSPVSLSHERGSCCHLLPLAPSCRPGTLLPPAGHPASGLEGEPSGSEGPRQAVLGLREPHGQRMPLQANKPGNSYKFNKIRLINYSSSPRVLFAAPRRGSWPSWAATAREKMSESRAVQVASGPERPPPGWPQGCRRGRAEAHGPRSAQGTGVEAEARPESSSVQTGHEQVQFSEGTAVAATQTRLALDEATDALKLLVAEPALV